MAAFEQGSFDINLLVEARGDVWEQLRQLGNGEDVTAVVQLASLVGLVVDAIRLVGGRQVVSINTDESGNRVTVGL